MAINLSDYTEFIHTECVPNEKLKIQAIKLDKPSGLKNALGCDGLKSCDYLKDYSDYLVLLEISDLSQSLKNLGGDEYKMLTGNLRKNFDPKKMLQYELRSKYTDTLTILCELKKQTLVINADKDKIYLIAICSNNLSDIIAFQTIGNNIKTNLKKMVKKVVVMSVNSLNNELIKLNN